MVLFQTYIHFYKVFHRQVNVHSAHCESLLWTLRLATFLAGRRREKRVSGDRVTDWISATNRVSYVCRATHINQSASTLLSGDTGLTLSFANAWLNKDEKTSYARLFRKYQGSGQDLSVCVCSVGTSIDWTTTKEAVFCNFDLNYLFLLSPFPSSIPCDKVGWLECRVQ